MLKKLTILSTSLFVLLIAYFVFRPVRKINFSTQVKPIFNKKCIACHGGVKRESGFSLLFREDAMSVAESGKTPIVPKDLDHSELIHRILSNDPEERMPYKKDPLTSEEIETLRQWIKEGALWGDHWAYVKVQPQELPNESWGTNAIDKFISEKADEQDLTPSIEAPKETLLRRASLDLTGLPPDNKLIQSFLSDRSPSAYEKLVDTLLASPHFGERWAAVWMDLARYADTKGYERDDSRTIWHYRDWLIDAFNKDMPYDQFIREQLAGDLLSNPTNDQYIATAFHRNTLTNDEGGTENEEFRVSAVLDRVNTTWEAFMGTTFACVQCHSHPYDPFRHDEYYKFMAFFNNTRDEDTFADYPLFRHLEKKDEAELASISEWISNNVSPEKANELSRFVKTWQPATNSLLGDHFVNSELNDTKWMILRNHAVCRLPGIDLDGKDELVFRFQNFQNGGSWKIHLDRPDGKVIKDISISKKSKDWEIMRVDFVRQSGVHDLFFTYDNPAMKSAEDNGMLFDWFYFTNDLDKLNASTYQTFWKLVTKDVPSTPVMIENVGAMRRKSQVFERGNWLVKGKEVSPDVPHSLNKFPDGAPKNRLGLAAWITSKDNPLTSRTIVNRVWEQLFGAGLAETLEDLGTQGVPPTHRELLDHLSFQLMNDYHWSLKSLIKEMVMSSTYRQSSVITPENLEKDPFNKYYARASRVRLSAEQVRDQALAVSGLLSPKMYGPSVMPYQPTGIWLSPWNGNTWDKSKGEDQYRRSLYTYWKRSAPYPSMMTFDGASHEVCTARRIRTNTPLQSLVTLNDSVFVEISHYLAKRMATVSGIENQIAQGYSMVMLQKISKEKSNVLLQLYQKALTSYRQDIITPVGNSSTPSEAEQKAMDLVANAILNLDETITRE
ncbi:MAG TPA: DUF1553 domain-containing protein [Cyclobacteriaceae bacterium]|nr:DUF1553 domain-containing protein [Cyclobacteriaceae bacterium]